MNIQLIQGQFSMQEAIDIITKMVDVKIKFQEGKITDSCSEEDVKMREKRIKNLQKELQDVRNFITDKNTTIEMQSLIEIE